MNEHTESGAEPRTASAAAQGDIPETVEAKTGAQALSEQDAKEVVGGFGPFMAWIAVEHWRNGNI